MSDLLDQFGNSALRLSKSPLGIIALFIVLVYGIAGLVFGLTGNSLENDEKIPLIYFLVLFPCLVLGLFGWLVSAHHTKLYAPSDYKNEEGFFRALTPAEQIKKLENEIKSNMALEKEPAKTAPVLTGAYKQPTKEFVGLDVTRRMLAEDLALKELQTELSIPIKRDVKLVGSNLSFDGVFPKNGKLFFVEVKFLRSPLSVLKSVCSIGNALRKYRDSIPPTISPAFMLVIVYNEMLEDSKTDAISALHHEMNTLQCEWDIKIYELDQLKRKYGISNTA